MKTAFLSLGSNLGDKIGYIQQAHKMLNFTDKIEVKNCSSFYETEPYGNKNQDWFVNVALEIKTSLSAEDLLHECLRIESQLGRQRDAVSKWLPRTIDIDIIFYSNSIITNKDLQIPHPEVHNRAFVLVPMLELNPDFVHPIIGKTILQMHSDLDDPEEIYLYGTRIKGL
jgi:2-amino-4-hydroxy-6-hydroxymethyldihydropteridine diphosphokinase